MFSSNSAKVLLVCLFFPTFFSACYFREKAESETPAPTPPVAKELKSDAPFSTKEPENFQAELIVTANGAEDKTFAARSGGRRLSIYNFGKKNQFSIVQTADGKSFALIKDKKIYAENVGENVAAETENPFAFLTDEWLSQKSDAKFERLGAENDLTKYRAVLGENGKSEALIWIDEKIGLPVKQEFYSVSGEQKTLNFTFEIKNFASPVNDNIFEISPDFRKVPIEEFRRILQSED